MFVVATTEDLTTNNDYVSGDFYRFISSTLVGIIDNTGLRYRGQDSGSTSSDTESYIMSNDDQVIVSNDNLIMDAKIIGSHEEDW